MRGAEWPDAISSEDPSTALAQQKGMAGALSRGRSFLGAMFRMQRLDV